MERLDSLEPAHPSLGAGLIAGVSVAKAAGVETDEAVVAVSSKLFWCTCVRQWLPLGYREELYQVLRLTGPLLLSRILNFLIPFVISIFCGHIGNAELAGYALASALINVTTLATGYGLGVACDTLISQTFGSKNLKRVGVILQRSSLILLLFCLPCWAVLINSHSLLLMMHQEDEVVRIAQIYVMIFLPAVPAIFLHHLQTSYLQNQGIILPQMYTAAVANLFNLGYNYGLIFSLKLGVVGSAIANSLSQITICLLLYGYIRWKKLHQQTWGGWSTECLQEWGSYMRLAIPSALMICFEWWIWDIGGFLSGILGEVELAAQHVMLEIGAITYMFPLGIYAATCVRVGNALGAADTTRALITCKVALVLSGVLAVLQGIVIASSKSVIGYIFTTDENIVEMVSGSLTVYTFLQFFDAILCACLGILVGSGMQKIAALASLVGYYCIGLPVGIALMFVAELGILGWWLGLLICSLFEIGFFLLLIFKLNWKKITYKAQVRAGKKVVMISNHSAGVVVPDISYCPTAQLDCEEKAPKADVYSAVNTQDEELNVAEGNNPISGGTEGDAEQGKNTLNTKPQVLLSVSQLILRRGLTFLACVLTLAIGVSFYLVFPPPEPSAQSRANFTLNWANNSTPAPLAPLDLTPDL
uniref:multidrug and toxin extrusion protein 1 n=1 Tax=Monopterus albus TaxID=43700 RepID=UPI0009B40348|nr:multidrug and toxin extrusion protein 1-like [Monopterus albus]